MRLALVGPTAAGKTAVGIALAQKLNAEVISADSMQVYRRMDIGTAKPTRLEQTQAVFHLIDVAEPDQEWTLADFQRYAEEACQTIADRDRLPLIVGGTGLYVRALTTRLDIPTAPPDEEFRARWRELAAQHGNDFVHNALQEVDPAAAARIHVNDTKRLIRALEVYETLGRTLSDLHAENQAQQTQENVFLFGLNFENRDALYARIDSRVDQMLEQGFLEEVRRLLAAGYGRDLKPMQSLGYRHLSAYLAGEADWETTVATLKQDTRKFARRQLIWFRADSRIHWIFMDHQTSDAAAEEIAGRIGSLLQNK